MNPRAWLNGLIYTTLMWGSIGIILWTAFR